MNWEVTGIIQELEVSVQWLQVVSIALIQVKMMYKIIREELNPNERVVQRIKTLVMI